MILAISFEQIYDIWSKKLWPSRLSAIEKTSAMNYLGGYDILNLNYTPSFFAYYTNNQIAGVNSGHLCNNNGYRSRGLYVEEKYRGQGIGQQLLEHTINLAKEAKASYVWSYPRQTSWNTYEKAGFTLSSNWEISEIGLNAYCVKELVPDALLTHTLDKSQ